MSRYNQNSSAVRRLLQEIKELREEPSDQFIAYPVDDNLFEWHFTIRGPKDTAFEGGRYHGRLLLPIDYPFKPPNIILLTSNGRFETNKKICLSITGYHPEYWQPAWGVRTAMLALISFLPTKGEGAIGALDYTDKERQDYAKRSIKWRCDKCEGESDYMLLKTPEGGGRTVGSSADAREDISMFQFTYEEPKEQASLPESSSSRNNTSIATSKGKTSVYVSPARLANSLPEANSDRDSGGTSSSPYRQGAVPATKMSDFVAQGEATEVVNTGTPTALNLAQVNGSAPANTSSRTEPGAQRLRRRTTRQRAATATGRQASTNTQTPFGLTRKQWDIGIICAILLLATLLYRKMVL